MTQNQERSSNESQVKQQGRTVKIRPKLWARPVLLCVGLWYKITRQSPSEEFTEWLTVHGFTVEFIANE